MLDIHLKILSKYNMQEIDFLITLMRCSCNATPRTPTQIYNYTYAYHHHIQMHEQIINA